MLNLDPKCIPGELVPGLPSAVDECQIFSIIRCIFRKDQRSSCAVEATHFVVSFFAAANFRCRPRTDAP